MSKVLFISEENEKIQEFKAILSGFEFDFASERTNIIDIIKVDTPDVILLDNSIKTLDSIELAKKIKSLSDSIMVILITKDENIEPDLLKTMNAFLLEPISKTLLISTINANLRTKNSLEMLASSNRDLAKSLYQLNVLYSTSSQFAGTLDKEDLTKFLIEGMDKSLGFELSCTLTFKNKDEPILIINSLYQVSERLAEALKLRTVLNFKTVAQSKKINFDFKLDNLKVVKHSKHLMPEYDLNILRFDNMFSAISISDNFFGFVEIYRENEFSTEDATCFQTLTQQVSLPLKSASLYEQIKKTNQKLEKLERLKSEFISIVSHELRTPLTAIKNSLDIILCGKAGDLTEAMEKFTNMAKRNVVRLSGIINDLLDLSKIEAGKMDFKFELSKIEPVIEYVKNNLSEIARERNLQLTLEMAPDLPQIYSDNHRLEQVLMNLVSNAIKFTNDGGSINISAKTVEAQDLACPMCFESELSQLNGQYLQVCVQDSGIGIAQSDLEKVFDKFAQIENSLSRKVGGSGLGLPIARQLLESHNGAIWCESIIDKGSKFYFVVPTASEKSNFHLLFKQKIQKARANNYTLSIIKMKETTSDLIEVMLAEKNLIGKNYLTNSFFEKHDGNKILTMIVKDGDKFSTDFLKKKLQAYLAEFSKNGGKHDIMFSYSIYPDDAIDEIDLIKKTDEGLELL